MSLIVGEVTFNSGSINYSANANVIVGNSNFCGNARNCGLISSGFFSNTSQNFGSINSGSFTGSSINNGTASTASFLGCSINSGTVTTGSFSETSKNLTSVTNGCFIGNSANVGIVSTACFLGNTVNSGIATNANFAGSSTNRGAVSTASFLNSAVNSGTVITGTFSDTSVNLTCVCNASFTGTSINRGTVTQVVFNGCSTNSGIVESAIFSGSAFNYGTINSSGLFYGTSSNSGIISGNAVFSGDSINIGTICGNASFLGNSCNNGGCIMGIATTENGDPYFFNNVMLLNGDGSNNQTNASFLDSGPNAITITNSSSTTQGSFSPYSPDGWSTYFNGSNASLLVPYNSAFLFGTGNFTLEAWIYLSSGTDGASTRNILSMNSTAGDLGFLLSIRPNSKLGFYTGSEWVAGNTTLALGQWYHVAAVREGTGANQSKLYINGNLELQFTNTVNNTLATQNLYIGAFRTGLERFHGYISNVRIVKGTALYTSNFTPSLSALTNIANTSLLTLQNNRFIDNSSNNFVITATGAYTQPLDPFNPAAAYNPETHGGSAYFNGTTSGLTFPSNSNFAFGTGNFTIEFWFNPTALSGHLIKLGAPTGDVQIYINANGSVTADFRPATLTRPLVLTSSTGAAVLNTWNHVALVRSGTGANQTKLYINGVLNSTTTVGTNGTLNYNFTNTGTGWVGRFDSSSYFTGYISNLRVVKGTAVYTSNFTPSTSPVTAIANTSLLLNFANGGIIDRSNKSILTLVGNVKISTAQIKYGTGSMYFDGTGDYLTFPTQPYLQFGDENFTIELWTYLIAKGTNGTCFIANYNTFSAGSFGIFAGHSTIGPTTYQVGFNGSTWLTTTTAIAYNQWTHLALVRNGTTLTLYINGVAAGSSTGVTATLNGVGSNWVVGTALSALTTFTVNGYIDDLRVTRGIARYTANFTVPDAALKLA